MYLVTLLQRQVIALYLISLETDNKTVFHFAGYMQQHCISSYQIEVVALYRLPRGTYSSTVSPIGSSTVSYITSFRQQHCTSYHQRHVVAQYLIPLETGGSLCFSYSLQTGIIIIHYTTRKMQGAPYIIPQETVTVSHIISVRQQHYISYNQRQIKETCISYHWRQVVALYLLIKDTGSSSTIISSHQRQIVALSMYLISLETANITGSHNTRDRKHNFISYNQRH